MSGMKRRNFLKSAGALLLAGIQTSPARATPFIEENLRENGFFNQGNLYEAMDRDYPNIAFLGGFFVNNEYKSIDVRRLNDKRLYIDIDGYAGRFLIELEKEPAGTFEFLWTSTVNTIESNIPEDFPGQRVAPGKDANDKTSLNNNLQKNLPASTGFKGSGWETSTGETIKFLSLDRLWSIASEAADEQIKAEAALSRAPLPNLPAKVVPQPN